MTKTRGPKAKREVRRRGARRATLCPRCNAGLVIPGTGGRCAACAAGIPLDERQLPPPPDTEAPS